MAEELTAEQEKAKKDARSKEFDTYSAPFLAKNKALGNAKGLRSFTSSTRGKGSMFINYEGFDVDSPETLPASLKEFMEITKIDDQKEILALVIEGFNANAYQTASDPIAEFVNGNWDKDTQMQFRLVVRNMSKAANMSIEDVVKLVKPGVEAKFAAGSK